MKNIKIPMLVLLILMAASTFAQQTTAIDEGSQAKVATNPQEQLDHPASEPPAVLPGNSDDMTIEAAQPVISHEIDMNEPCAARPSAESGSGNASPDATDGPAKKSMTKYTGPTAANPSSETKPETK